MRPIVRALSRRLRSRDDAGMTLVELLVGIALFGVLGTLLLGLGLSTVRVTNQTKAATAVTEEARHALERLTRELRQASKITAAEMVGEEAVAITAEIDFNGNGQIEPSSVDPEVVTYRWDAASPVQALTLTANVNGQPQTHPVLAGRVSNFSVQLWSSRWDYDTTAPSGTTWREIDAVGLPVGDKDGRPDGCASVPTDPDFCATQIDELALIDRLHISLTVAYQGGAQTYATDVHLRNGQAG